MNQFTSPPGEYYATQVRNLFGQCREIAQYVTTRDTRSWFRAEQKDLELAARLGVIDRLSMTVVDPRTRDVRARWTLKIGTSLPETGELVAPRPLPGGIRHLDFSFDVRFKEWHRNWPRAQAGFTREWAAKRSTRIEGVVTQGRNKIVAEGLLWHLPTPGYYCANEIVRFTPVVDNDGRRRATNTSGTRRFR